MRHIHWCENLACDALMGVICFVLQEMERACAGSTAHAPAGRGQLRHRRVRHLVPAHRAVHAGGGDIQRQTVPLRVAARRGRRRHTGRQANHQGATAVLLSLQINTKNRAKRYQCITWNLNSSNVYGSRAKLLKRPTSFLDCFVCFCSDMLNWLVVWDFLDQTGVERVVQTGVGTFTLRVRECWAGAVPHNRHNRNRRDDHRWLHLSNQTAPRWVLFIDQSDCTKVSYVSGQSDCTKVSMKHCLLGAIIVQCCTKRYQKRNDKWGLYVLQFGLEALTRATVTRNMHCTRHESGVAEPEQISLYFGTSHKSLPGACPRWCFATVQHISMASLFVYKFCVLWQQGREITSLSPGRAFVKLQWVSPITRQQNAKDGIVPLILCVAFVSLFPRQTKTLMSTVRSFVGKFMYQKPICAFNPMYW